MEEDAVLQIGAAGFTWSDLKWIAIPALVGAGLAIVPWARWHFRAWRIRRAEARGDREQAEILALDHELEEPPRTLRATGRNLAFILVATPALMAVQINLMDELERMLGKGWSFAAMLLTVGLIAACSWAWGQVRRNAMSPDEIATLEEEQEHQRWLRSIEGDSMPGLLVALAGAAAILTAIYFLTQAITPG